MSRWLEAGGVSFLGVHDQWILNYTLLYVLNLAVEGHPSISIRNFNGFLNK